MKASRVIQNVITEIPEIGKAKALVYIQQVHRWLYQNYIIKSQSFTLSLTANDYKLELDPTVRRVRTAVFYRSATDEGIPLLPGSTFDWDREYPNWRTRTSGTPTDYAVEEDAIIIYPKPKDATVNGYPVIIAECAVASDLAEDDELPRNVSPDLYAEGIKFWWARNNCRERLVESKELFDLQVANLNNTLQ